MKRQLLTSIAVVLATLCSGQSDSIFSNNKIILCSVKEITPDAVKFSFPEEDLLNSIYKNSVQKIVFKNGRVQIFSESTSFKSINGVDDFENVTISQLESEVKGLFKLGDVSAKAVGTTELSNQERVKQRAYRKMKMVAAMMGANIIYLTNQRTEGNKMGGYYQGGSTAETNLTGVAYTNQLPSFEEFANLINVKKRFIAVEEANLYSSASTMTKKVIQKRFIINKVTNESGLIMLYGVLEGNMDNRNFRVVSFDNKHFNIYFKDKNTSYNTKIEL